MSELSKQALKVENNQSFPNNNAGLITPTNLRTFNEDMIDSTVNQATYTADSASFDARINAVTSSINDVEWTDVLNKPANLVSSSTDTSTIDITINNGSVSAVAIGGIVSGSSQVVLEDTTYTDNGDKSFLQTDGAGNLSFQYVDTIWESFYAGESVPKGTPLYFSGSQGANSVAYAADASNPAKMPVVLIAGDNLTAGQTYEGIVLGLIEGLNLTGYTAGQTVYVAEGGGWTTNLPSGSASITQPLGIVTKGGNGGKGLVLNPGPASLPGLQTGYIWVGNGNNRAIAIPSSSLSVDTSGLATTGSNTFIGTQTIEITGSEGGIIYKSGSSEFFIGINGNGNLVVSNSVDDNLIQINSSNGWIEVQSPQTNFNGGVALRGNTNARNITTDTGLGFVAQFDGFTASLQEGYAWVGKNGGTSVSVPTASFAGAVPVGTATTGSNTFNGNQTITGSVNIDGDMFLDDDGGTTSFFINRNFNSEFKGITNRWYESTQKAETIWGEKEVELLLNAFSSSYDNALYFNAGQNGAEFSDWNGSYTRTPWLKVPSQGTPAFQRGLEVTGSTNLQNLTASLQEGYVWVGDSNGKTTTVPTSSFGGGGSINTGSFATTGSNTFTGQQNIQNSLYIEESGNPLIYTSFLQDQITNKLIVNQAGASGIQLNSINVELGQLTASLQQGYALVGNASGLTQAVPTSSFAGSTINTGSFATTGSNVFDGGQTIFNGGLSIQGNPQGSGSAYAIATATVDITTDPTNVYSAWQLVEPGGNNLIAMAVNSYTGEYPSTPIPILFGGGNNPNSSNAGIAFPSNGEADHWKKSNFKYGIDVTGSIKLTPASVSTNASYPIPFISGSTISKDSVDTLTYNPSTNVLRLTGSAIANKVSAFDFDTLFYGSQMGGSTANGTFFGYGSTDYSLIVGAYAGGFDNELKILADNTGVTFGDFNGSAYPSWLKLIPNSGTNPAPQFTRGIDVVNGSGITLKANTEGSGSAYAGVTAIVDVDTDPTNVYSALQLVKPNGDALMAMAANSYTPQYSGITIPMLFGGGNNPDGNNAGIAFPTNGQMDVWKKSNFKYGTDITGSITQTSGNNNFAGNITAQSNVIIGGTLSVTSSNANFRDILMDDPGATTSLLQNPNFFSEFKGNALRWLEGSDSASLIMGENHIETLYNAFADDYSYDRAFYVNVGSYGVQFSDWDGGYNRTPWLNVAQQGDVRLLRDTQVTGSVSISETMKLKPQDPLPTGTVGELAVSGSSLYFYNGAWTLVV